MKKIYIFILMVLGITGFVACGDDECGEWHIDTDLMGIPVVMKGSFPIGALNPALGDSVVFAPRLLDTTGVSFSWNVNGEVVSTDSVFTFRVEKPCRAKIVCTLKNAKGQVVMESDITSKHDFSKGFFVVQKGELDFYDKATGNYYKDCFASLNFGKQLANEGSISPVRIGGKLYIPINNNITNVDHLTVADGVTLYRERSAGLMTGITAFVSPDSRQAFVSANGLTRLDLNTLTSTRVFQKYSWNFYNSLVYQGHLLMNLTYGSVTKVGRFEVEALVAAKEDQQPEMKELNVFQNGKFNFVQGKDGAVYTISCDETGTAYFLARMTSDGAVQEIPLSFQPAKPKYHSGATIGMAASVSGDALYIASADHQIYKYVLGEESSLNQPFINFVPEESAICCDLQVDPSTGELLVCYSEEVDWEEYAGKVVCFDLSGKVVRTLDCGDGMPRGILFL